MLMWHPGADREPELLQHVFGCLSSLFRHLVRHLAADLPGRLRQTARLRYHRADHVRRLAAQAVGFLFRHAPRHALRSGARTVFAGESLSVALRVTLSHRPRCRARIHLPPPLCASCSSCPTCRSPRV